VPQPPPARATWRNKIGKLALKIQGGDNVATFVHAEQSDSIAFWRYADRWRPTDFRDHFPQRIFDLKSGMQISYNG
jgi:hypothetical protein